MGLPLPETFWAAIEKGVCDIADGELRKLNVPEKRQLLSILRKHEDCPVGWKNIDPSKPHSILHKLHQAIERLLDPEEFKKKQQAYNARNNKKRRENGKQKATNDRNVKRRRESGKAKEYNAIYYKRIRENGKAKEYSARNRKRYRLSGKQKEWNDRKSAKRSKATREANAQAILDNQDHHEDTWDEARLEKEATDIVETIVEKCGPDGFVHVCGGAWPRKNLNEAVEAECFGKGRNRHVVFIDGGKFVHYRDVSVHVELLTPYSGTNCLNADELEKRVQKKLIDMGWPQHRRMFVHAGKGSCKGKRAAEIPFPYYTCVLTCEQSMEQIGIRLATTEDHKSKRKHSSSSL